MDAKSIDRDSEMIVALANHAHGLIAEFVALREHERDRAAELLAQLQSVINEFRRRRPAPTFRIVSRRPPLGSVHSNDADVELESEVVEMPAREFKGHRFERGESEGIFRCERCHMITSRDRQTEPQTWRFSGGSFYVVVSSNDILEQSPIIPHCRPL